MFNRKAKLIAELERKQEESKRFLLDLLELEPMLERFRGSTEFSFWAGDSYHGCTERKTITYWDVSGVREAVAAQHFLANAKENAAKYEPHQGN